LRELGDLEKLGRDRGAILNELGRVTGMTLKEMGDLGKLELVRGMHRMISRAIDVSEKLGRARGVI